jgi:flagellar hook-associated protein 1 FlgK
VTSPFFGLDIATRALRTQQTLVDITNQNVANANTPGYSRQTAELKASAAYPIPVFNQTGIGQLGTGVEITQISRARDTFLDGQVRNQLSSQGRWDARQAALTQLEASVNEPSSTGLSATLTKYFQGWQEVANSPSDSSVRASLIQQGQAVVDVFHHQYQTFTQQQQDLDNQIGLTVTDINDYAQQIANINKQISMVETAGMKANDLRDQRDQLLDKLSGLARVTYVESGEGSVSVYLGSRQLVDRDRANQLQAVAPPGQRWVQVQWASDGAATGLADGKLKGIVESRDTVVQARIDDLDTLAKRVISSVNSLHASGVGLDGKTGLGFFTGSDAATIGLDAQLTGPNGTDHVAAARMYADAASGSGYNFARGDSSNAVALGALANSVAQLGSSSGLQPGTSLGGAPPVTVLGASVLNASANTTYSVSAPGGTTVTFSDGVSTQTGTVTVGQDSAGNQIVTVDAGSFGVRLALSAPAGASLNSVLAKLDGQSLSTAISPTTIGDQYAQQVATLGVESSTAQGESANQQVLVKHLQTQRDSVSGVSLDEETTHLIQYQRAYQAAARVVTVVDSMLDTLINDTGRVGR